MIGKPLARQGRAQQFPKTPLHPVADDGVADLLGDGDPVSLAKAIVRPRKQHETGARNALAPVRGKEIGAASNHRDRLAISRSA